MLQMEIEIKNSQAVNYSLINKNAYDILADEYENRVKVLLPVTTDSVTYFAPYIKPGGSVLDIGCAVGLTMSVLKQKGFNVTGIEISPQMAAYAKKRNPTSEIIVGDFLMTNFDEKFDGVLAFAFIHLFPKKDFHDIFLKIKSILKPGGVALLSSTESRESREGWYQKEDFNKKEKRFRKFWTEKELEESLADAGFQKLALVKFPDPYGKVWMDFVVKI